MKPLIDLKPIDTEAKNRLAKILAAENIVIEFSKNAEGASFNTRTRTLVLPNWDIKNEDVFDTILAHEVGHALHTPMTGWESFSRDVKADKTKLAILHLVEDARIEKIMRRKWQGLRLTFPRGYRALNDDNYFGIAGKDLRKYSLPDRLNLFAKMGFFIDVPFNKSENKFLDEIENLETWEDTLDLTQKLIEQLESKGSGGSDGDESSENKKGDGKKGEGKPKKDGKGEKSPAEKGKPSEKGDPSDSEDDEDENDGEGSDGDSDGEGDTSNEVGAVPNIDDFAKDKEKGKKGQKGQGEGEGEDGEGEDGETIKVPSLGDLFAGRNITGQDFVPSNTVQTQTEQKTPPELPQAPRNSGDSTNLYMSSSYPMYRDVLVPWKALAPIYAKNSGQDVYSSLHASFQPQVNYMFKEFETKKRAREFRRVNPSRKGGIDMSKIHRYKFDDQIFLTKTTEMTGKSHGVVILVDFSGSMRSVIGSVIDQLMMLTSFFRKSRIKYEVLAFSDSIANTMPHMKPVENKTPVPSDLSNKLRPGTSHMRLVNLLSGRMTMSEHKSAVNALKNTFDIRGYGSSQLGFSLGGTPLDESVAATASFITDFRTSEAIDVVHFITITDGMGGSMSTIDPNGAGWSGLGAGSILTDIETRKRYTSDPKTNERYFTATLYRYLRDVHKMNVIGFYLTGGDGTVDVSQYANAFGYDKNANRDMKGKNYVVECGGQSVTFFVDNKALRNTTGLKDSFLRVFVDLIAK